MEFEKEEYVEFSKLSQDKVIATSMDHAFMYDVETGKRIQSFEPRMSNQYIKNRATLDPTDSLVLSDGVLWDVNAGKEIHKFDKLNENINGVFHPNGLEIICNSEVWDVRTFKLLKTVRAADQSWLTFTNDGNVIYGIKSSRETTDGFKTGDTSFVTLDAGDYSSIGTIELKRSILSLATSPNDLQIALVENHGAGDSTSDSCIRYYEVGRSRYGEDEQVDEEDDDLQSRDSDADEENDDDEDDDDDQEDLDRILDELLPGNELGDEVNSSQDEDDGDGAVEFLVSSDDEDDDDDDEGSLSLASTTDEDSD
jgi:HIV-1 Vpr-binding protein